MLIAEAFVLERFAPQGVPQSGSQGDDQFLGTGYAENYRCMFPVKFPVFAVACIRQGHFSGHQAQQLGGVRGFKSRWWNAELSGVKGHCRKKTATVAVDMVRTLRIGIIVVVQLVVAFRRIGDAVDTVAHGAPVFLHILRAGKHAAHADDGYRLLIMF